MAKPTLRSLTLAIGAVIAAGLPFGPGAAAANFTVSSGDELKKAVNRARAGDIITVLPGTILVDGGTKIQTQNAGREDAPITIRANRLGDATIRVNRPAGIEVIRPYWVVENLSIVGACKPASHADCEHAFHVVGNADHLHLRNVRLVDFNAAIKGNGFGPQGKRDYPDHVTIERSFIYNTQARNTRSPVTPIDVVGGKHWVVRGNLIADYERLGRSPISYHGFFKGNSMNGLFERNLVICEWRHRGGLRVGLSFGGGGGESNKICEDGDCTNRHSHGVMRNNIVMNCPADVGIYVNKGKDSHIYNNLLFNTGGIDVRFEQSQALLQNNIVTGSIRARNGGQFNEDSNLLAGSWLGIVLGPGTRYVKRRLDGQDLKYPRYISKGDVEWVQGMVDDVSLFVANSWLGFGNNTIRDLFRQPDAGDFTVTEPERIVDRANPIADLKDDFCGQQRGPGPHDIGPFEVGASNCDPRRRIERLLEVERVTPEGPPANAKP